MGNDVGMWQGLEKATGTIADTGMELMKQRSMENRQMTQDALAQSRLKLEQEQSARENKLRDMKIKQEEDDARLIDVDDQLDRLGFSSDEEKKYFKSKMPLDIEQVAGRDYVRKSIGREALKKHIIDPQFQYEIGSIKMVNLDQSIAQLTAQVQSPDSKLKPEQIEQIQQQLEQMRLKRTSLANGIKRAEAQLKIKEEMPYGAAGGGVVYDKRTGKPTYSPPQKSPPSRATEFDRDYNAYLQQAKQNYPNLRPMNREEFRDDRIRRGTKARVAGKEPQPEATGVNVEQERAWAQEAIKAGKNKAEVIKNFEQRTGQKF